MNLVFCAHGSTNTEDSTPAPGDLRFDPRDNRCTISKNNTLRPVRAVRLTPGTSEC